MVYEPSEDSQLLAKQVASLARGRVLDMGTGSGIQAFTAAQNKSVTKVLAVDVDPEAVSSTKVNCRHEKITVRESDLFSKVRGSFDTIIFNPPYLPAEQGLTDQALIGGRHGYELFCQFLNQSVDFLAPGGQILAVYSSLTKPAKVKECSDRLLLNLTELAREHVFFEDLIVVKIAKLEIRSALEADKFTKLHYLAKGKRGMIFTALYKKSRVAIKIKNPSSMAPAAIAHESAMLERLNKKDIGPKLIHSSKEYVAYRFVDGVFIQEFLEKSSRQKIIKVLRTILDQCRIMDKIGISKEEMTRPVKHILVQKDGKPVMIDFERAHVTARPHNVTQFCQFLSSGFIRFTLASKGIIIDQDHLIDLAREYRLTLSDSSFKRIRAQIK